MYLIPPLGANHDCCHGFLQSETRISLQPKDDGIEDIPDTCRRAWRYSSSCSRESSRCAKERASSRGVRIPFSWWGSFSFLCADDGEPPRLSAIDWLTKPVPDIAHGSLKRLRQLHFVITSKITKTISLKGSSTRVLCLGVNSTIVDLQQNDRVVEGTYAKMRGKQSRYEPSRNRYRGTWHCDIRKDTRASSTMIKYPAENPR
jgi:hypothetical protein